LTLPIESEVFFTALVEHFDGTKEQFLAYVREHIRDWFRWVKREPEWIQSPEWRFFNGKPMVFVDQIDLPGTTGVFHDDARFYVFWDPDSGVTDVIIQVA
jgi:hypothetical protein